MYVHIYVYIYVYIHIYISLYIYICIYRDTRHLRRAGGSQVGKEVHAATQGVAGPRPRACSRSKWQCGVVLRLRGLCGDIGKAAVETLPWQKSGQEERGRASRPAAGVTFGQAPEDPQAASAACFRGFCGHRALAVALNF